MARLMLSGEVGLDALMMSARHTSYGVQICLPCVLRNCVLDVLYSRGFLRVFLLFVS